MTLKPHFMPNKPGFNPWEPSSVREVPLLSALTFSSKSPFLYDNWCRDVVRPFQIVVFPGYVPDMSSHVLRDTDRAWFGRSFVKPTIIWDGFCPLALFEVIYEVFGQTAASGHMKVRNVASKTWVKDIRSASLLASRPKKSLDMPDPLKDAYAYKMFQQDHRRALIGWARECANSDLGGYHAQAQWRKMAGLYVTSLKPKTEFHEDSVKRKQLAEAKWHKNHLAPIVEKTTYTSPIDSVEIKVDAQFSRQIDQATSRRVLSQPDPVVHAVRERELFRDRIFSKMRIFG